MCLFLVSGCTEVNQDNDFGTKELVGYSSIIIAFIVFIIGFIINRSESKKAWGIASLVFGILSFIFLMLGFLWGISAIIFSIIQKRHGKTGFATAGMILGIIGTCFSLFILGLLPW